MPAPRLIRTPWKYRGKTVYTASTAEIVDAFQPGGVRAHLVEQALDRIKPWQPSNRPQVKTCRFPDENLLQEVVRVSVQQDLIWGIHAQHHYRQPGLSPFIKLSSLPRTDTLAIIILGEPKKPVITSISGVDPQEPYTPPLPWMEWLLAKTPGEKKRSLGYWQTHAYLLYTPKLITKGTQGSEPPSWRYARRHRRTRR